MNFRMELPSRSQRLIVTPRHSKSWSLPLRDSHAAMTIAIAAIADSHPDCRWIPISSTGLTKPSSITPDLRNARMSLSTRLSVTPRPRRKPSNVIHHGDQGTSVKIPRYQYVGLICLFSTRCGKRRMGDWVGGSNGSTASGDCVAD